MDKSTQKDLFSRAKLKYSGFPDEIIGEILLRSPVKSLLRFRSVCKSWTALICKPSFINEHAEKARKNNNYHHLFIYEAYLPPKILEFSIRGAENIHEAYKRIKGAPWKERLHSLVGSWNGIVCFRTEFPANEITLWNPMINQSRSLPYHKNEYEESKGCLMRLGFGSAENSSEGKIVRISNYKGRNMFIVDVYRLTSDSWCNVNGDIPSSLNLILSDGITFNGFAHWMCKDQIVSFDFATEAFHEIKLWSHSNSQIISDNISVLHECLAVFAEDYSPIKLFDMEIWVMNEYGIAESWTKLYVIPNWIKQPLGFTSDGKILFEKLYFFNSSSRLLSYDPTSKMTEILEENIPTLTFSVGSLTETLVSVASHDSRGQHALNIK